MPLNEHCWLDIDSGIPASRRGEAYRRAITAHVAAINAQGMVAVLDLHWHAPGTRRTDNNPMPNRDNSPRFWRSVAAHFQANPSVVFELANEPHPDGGADSAEAWRCWRDGGTCRGTVDIATGQPYVAAGMQELMDAVRSTGARQLVLVGGVQWTNRLSGWTSHRPVDPVGNTGAAWHVYNFNGCTSHGVLGPAGPAGRRQRAPGRHGDRARPGLHDLPALADRLLREPAGLARRPRRRATRPGRGTAGPATPTSSCRTGPGRSPPRGARRCGPACSRPARAS